MFQLVRGIRIEALADGWAAFSPQSGESLLLNTEAAAVLDVLAEGPAGTSRICLLLARDTGLEPREVEDQLVNIWPQLLTAGLICEVTACGDNQA